MVNRVFKSRGLGVLNNSYSPGAPAEPNPGDIVPDAPLVLEIWYDASTNEYFQPTNPSDGGGITQWNDLSAYAHNLNPVVGGPGGRPNYRTNQLNSLGALEFDGSDACSSNPATWLQNLTGASMFIVSRFSNGSSGVIETQAQSDCGDMGYGKNAANEYELYMMTGQVGAMSATPTTPVGTDSSYHIQSIIFDGTGATDSDRLKFRLDESDVPLTYTDPVPSAFGGICNSFIVGSDYQEELGNQFTGFVAELVFYSRTLTASEISGLETYFANKWDL